MKLEEVAKVTHEANRAYREVIGEEAGPHWEDAPQWQKDSVVAGVRAKLQNLDVTPEQSHEGWLSLKLREGWKYGPVKDVEKKEHPCCLPYKDLPPEQRLKDELFLAVVMTFQPQVPPAEYKKT